MMLNFFDYSCINWHWYVSEYYKDCFHTRVKVRNLNLNSKSAIWMMVFWTVCTQNYIVMCNSYDGHLKCAFQITHRDVIFRTHVPKYCHSNDHSNCAIQITHRDIILCTHSPIPSFKSSVSFHTVTNLNFSGFYFFPYFESICPNLPTGEISSLNLD